MSNYQIHGKKLSYQPLNENNQKALDPGIYTFEVVRGVGPTIPVFTKFEANHDDLGKDADRYL